jgi:hypothetical protein
VVNRKYGHDTQGVAGSSPARPTNKIPDEQARVISVRRQLKREGGALVTADTKTARSRRSVNLPRGLVNLLVEHRRRQEEERIVMDELWN